MPVSGREISSLDFGNLIGGPLNAVVEAQGKSAIATANFIKEVGFDKDGKVKNVEFKYNRKNESGSDQEFSLTLPFLTMVPIPYISVSNAEIEFNAKITSITESSSADNFKIDASVDAGANWWFASARMTTKSSYQRTTSTSDKEERTFDMRIKVQARNVDMPAGTERVLTLLENSIQERTNNKLSAVGVVVKKINGSDITLEAADYSAISIGSTFMFAGKLYKINKADATTHVVTLDQPPSALMLNKSIDVQLPLSVFVTAVDTTAKTITVKELPSAIVVGTKLSNGTNNHDVTVVNAAAKTLTFADVTGFAQDTTLYVV